MNDGLPAEVEDAFRLMAFYQYYRKSQEKSNTLRFAQAIIDSSRPITTDQQRQAIMQWYEGRRKKVQPGDLL